MQRIGKDLDIAREEINDNSGMSEEGRENMMRLKYEMENRDILEKAEKDS